MVMIDLESDSTNNNIVKEHKTHEKVLTMIDTFVQERIEDIYKYKYRDDALYILKCFRNYSKPPDKKNQDHNYRIALNWLIRNGLLNMTVNGSISITRLGIAFLDQYNR